MHRFVQDTFVILTVLTLSGCSASSAASGLSPSTPDAGAGLAREDGDAASSDAPDATADLARRADQGAPDATPPGPFSVTPGASIWIDGVERVALVYGRDPVGPPLLALSAQCPESLGFRVHATYVFEVASRDWTWDESCPTLGDGSTYAGRNGHRVLTSDEASALVAALRAVTVVAPTASCVSDADVATATVSVERAARTYRDQDAFPCSATPVARLLDALRTAHSLTL